MTYARRREGSESRYPRLTMAAEIEDHGGQLTSDGRRW
jgi:hypothetical protein